MKRRQFLQSLLAGPAAHTFAQQNGEGRGRPNVVIFLTDDQAYGDLGVHGNTVAATPNIDAFAKESVSLSRFYVCPVCAPTRASLLTGRWHLRTGVTSVQRNTYNMRTEEVTLAESLREAGYATAVFGKWHLGEEAPHRPGDQGFEESVVHRSSGIYKPNSYFNPRLLHNGAWKQYEGYCQRIWIDHAVRFLDQRKQDGRPFFLYLPTNLMHEPLIAEEHHLKAYREKGLPDDTAGVYAMQNSVDEGFGRLLRRLSALGFSENTLVLYTSDNGPQGWPSEARHMAGLQGMKGSVYENGIRVPCFLRWPAGGLRPGRRIGRIAAHIDVTPTMLDACGTPLPRGVKIDGRSLLPLLDGRQNEGEWPDRTLFFQWDARDVPDRESCFAAMNQRYKLVQARGNIRPKILQQYADVCNWHGPKGRTIDGPPKYELFDIEADPGERTDIAADHPEMVESLRKQYYRWFDETQAG